MSISSRIHDTIEDWQAEWKVRLYGWLTDVIKWGIELFFNVLGKAAAPKLTPFIEQLEATGKVPPELQPILDEMKTPTGQVAAMFAQSAGGSLIGGAFGKIVDAVLLPVAYELNKQTKNVILAESQYLILWLRGAITEEYFTQAMYAMGHNDDDIAGIKALAQVRFDPSSVITAWRRDPAKYETLFQDLKDQGWDDDRLEALKFITLYYPSPAELVHWTAREVFEPDKIAKYGLMADADKLRRDDFYKAGMDDEQIDNNWIAHWEHASWVQVVEMLHRKLITEQDVKDWFPLVEVAPYWADNLIQMAYSWPTRVDVRRWRDMAVITKEELRTLYEGQGYHGKWLDLYCLWTEVYNRFPDLVARFRNGWITEAEVKSELITLGMPAERVEEMWQAKFKPEAAAQVEEERKATATEIMKGVKTGYISRAEGVEMLGDLGYSAEVADFKLDVYLGVSSGSPETYGEFKRMTQLYLAARGLPAKIPPEDLIQAEKNVVETKAALEFAKAEGTKEAKLTDLIKAVSDATYRYHQLLTLWRESKA